jgi:hypothetical protein
MGFGFLPHAFATALEAFGLPRFIAISLYDLVSPYGIFSISFHTDNSKEVGIQN